MELTDLLGTRTITVSFGANTVTVTYRAIENVITKREGVWERNVADELVRYVESWDVTKNRKPVPLEKKFLEDQVPIDVLRRILLAILDDAGFSLGEASSNSDGG